MYVIHYTTPNGTTGKCYRSTFEEAYKVMCNYRKAGCSAGIDTCKS